MEVQEERRGWEGMAWRQDVVEEGREGAPQRAGLGSFNSLRPLNESICRRHVCGAALGGEGGGGARKEVKRLNAELELQGK